MEYLRFWGGDFLPIPPRVDWISILSKNQASEVGTHMRKIFSAIVFIVFFILISVVINNLTYGISKALNISDDVLFIAGIIISLTASFFITRKIFKQPKGEDDSLGN